VRQFLKVGHIADDSEVTPAMAVIGRGDFGAGYGPLTMAADPDRWI